MIPAAGIIDQVVGAYPGKALDVPAACRIVSLKADFFPKMPEKSGKVALKQLPHGQLFSLFPSHRLYCIVKGAAPPSAPLSGYSMVPEGGTRCNGREGNP
jgi:hypothetical protein